MRITAPADPPKRAKTKPKRKPTSFKTAYYVVEITSWEWDFSFGINKVPKLVEEPYADYRHLVVKGALLRPAAVKVKDVEITFVPRWWLDPARVSDAKYPRQPTDVGSISQQGSTIRGTFIMPADAIGPLLTMLVADRIRFLVLDGEAFRYRQASISRYSFQRAFTDDDLPTDQA